MRGREVDTPNHSSPKRGSYNVGATTSGDDFTVGGERAAYPGDRRLSARNRIHCRCTTVTTGLVEVFRGQ
jgi:hypothetical protein